MISFTLTDIGKELLDAASIENPLIITSVSLYSGNTQCYNTNKFIGNTILDDAVGSYILIEFSDNSEDSYTCNIITLEVDDNIIAISDGTTLYNKQSDKRLNFRIDAQFTDVEKCTFNSISVNLPYATSQHAGIVSFSRFEDSPKQSDDRTVYSAYDTDRLIAKSGGGSSTKDPVYIANTLSGLNNIGSLGLFVYMNISDKPILPNTIIDGSLLRYLGMTLTEAGDIKYTISNDSIKVSGSWRVLNIGMRNSALSRSIILAIKVATDTTTVENTTQTVQTNNPSTNSASHSTTRVSSQPIELIL